jgi:DNA gyrase subunit A
MSDYAREIVPIRIQDEMRSSYLDYSMSVIVGRALPDVRDGLKPVHRRILYAMHRMGLAANKKYVKCAGVVGEVLKLYHPHGDSAVYDALVRMAQPWNLRYMLVDGQGNFGSVDGDPAAAYRYTECRLTKLAEEMLVDIDKETVDYGPNFDGSTEEPLVLPSRLPNLLINGADGIAVGMATKIPPHNLGEIVDACVALIDNPDLDLLDLMSIVPGPDFPTAGAIHGRKGIRDAYETGRGRIIVRGNAAFEDLPSGRRAITIDELPYQVNKARLIEQIAGLVRDKRIEGISGLRDESDRTGMRIVIELKRDAFEEVVLNHLFKHTPLQSTFGVIMLAIVNNRPRVLSLKEMLAHYIAHRREVILRRTRYELRRARERAHILEGYLIGLDHIDRVIEIIRASPTGEVARAGLMEEFGLSEIQAQAILDMRLQRLTGLERQKIQDEYEALLERIGYLEGLLASEYKLMGVVKDELLEIRESYADVRRTRIEDARHELTMHDLVAEEDQVVTLSHLGYIKRCRPDEWRTQKRGGMGKRGMTTREADFVTSLFIANTHDILLVFTTAGRVFPLHVYEVPEAGRAAKGKAIVNLVPIRDDEKLAALVPIRTLKREKDDGEEGTEDSEEVEEDVVEEEEPALLFISRKGLIKQTSLHAYRNLRQGGMIAAGVAEGDALVVVRIIDAFDQHVMLFTRGGQCIRFAIDQVPEFGRTARGNRGVALVGDDEVVDALLVPSLPVPAAGDEEDEAVAAPEDDAPVPTGDEVEEESGDSMLLTATELGYGKRTGLVEYRPQNRNGKGIISIQTPETSGQVVGSLWVTPDDTVMLVTDTGRVIRFVASDVRTVGRNTRGVRLMRLDDGERIVDLAKLAEDDDSEE